MGRRRQYIGTVTSDKMQKTIIVKVKQMNKHPKYNRIVKGSNTFKAHDEEGKAHLGDTVRIEETRPLSKDKRYRLVEILKKAEAPHLVLKEEVQDLLGEAVQPESEKSANKEGEKPAGGAA